MMNTQFNAGANTTINAPVGKVWDALINPVLIKQYLFGSDVVSDWKEGSTVVYRGTFQGKAFEDKGKVVTVEPEKQLVCTHWSPQSGTSDSPENYHTVSYALSPEDSGVRVTITQDNNANEAEKDQNSQFWATVLTNLKKLLETG